MVNDLFPLLDAADGLLGSLPLVLRVCLWGLVAGVAAMALYAIASPQGSIQRLKLRAAELRRKMLDAELEASAFGQLARENIAVSLGLLGRVIGPALLSVIPVLVVASWIDTTRGYEAVAEPAVRAVEPATAAATLRPGPEPRSVEVVVDGRPVYSGRPLDPPTPVIHKRVWWNAILANPAGYIAADAPIDEVTLDVEKRVFANWLPRWAAGWELPFFVAVFLSTLTVKFGFRIA